MLLGTLAVAGACLATPHVAGAQAPAQDSVVGTGITTPTYSNGAIDITSGPSGENPTGSASVVFAGERFVSTSVQCLSVSGNTATFVIGLAPNSLGALFGRATVVDNSSSGIPDTISIAGHLAPAPDCGPEIGFAGTEPLIAGNIVVVDAPPLPTSKDQCKNGGHVSFGFKNQGECVAFVQRGPKPKP
jgi:hypothetical protein